MDKSSNILDLAELAAAMMTSGMAITITIEPSGVPPEKESEESDEDKKLSQSGWDALMDEVFFKSQTSNSIGGGSAVAASGILQGVNTP